MKEGDREEVTHEQFEVIRAITGLESQDFKRSKLGQYIFDRIDMDLDNMTKDLLDTDPHDVEKCIKIRNDILVRNLFILFVNEAIASGNNAEHNLEQMAKQDY